MATLEMNALSTILCGSFSTRIFLPEMNLLTLDDEGHTKKYPALYLLHTEGGEALDFMSTMAEKCAVEYGIFIICPDVAHTICTNMLYGANFEDFLATELHGIVRNNLPISYDVNETWVGGVGTGGYGAVKALIKHPEVFSKAVAMDGIFDMDKICKKALAGEDTGILQDKEALSAVFGDISSVAGSEHDVYALSKNCKNGKFLITGKKDSPYEEERKRLAKALGDRATYLERDGELMDFTDPFVLKEAVKFLCEEVK